jgi:hypothetical protein
VLFTKFLATEMFPGSNLCADTEVLRRARAVGFAVTQVQSLQPHYARTLDMWAANLEAARDQAVAARAVEECERYMKYLTGCAGYFRSGHIHVQQFTLRLGVPEAAPAPHSRRGARQNATERRASAPDTKRTAAAPSRARRPSSGRNQRPAVPARRQGGAAAPASGHQKIWRRTPNALTLPSTPVLLAFSTSAKT